VTTAKAGRPHYLPASLIGGFGEPDTGRHAGHLRYAWVCMRLAGAPWTVARIRADNVAIQNGMYDVADPGPDLPADFAEQLWKQYEGALPGAVRALENDSWTRDDWRAVLLHVQAQSIRHPDFTRAVHEHLGEAAAAGVGPDDIQAERQRTFQGTRAWMARARFAVLRHHKPAERFLTNDKGYVPLHDVARDVRGVVFPLSGLVAVLMVVEVARPGDDYEEGPLAVRTLNANGMKIINEAAWDTVGIRCVIGHPNDEQAIAALVTGEKTVSMPVLGPYRGNREPGLFDWACPRLQVAARQPSNSRR
jgi:hypothetical protein